VTADLVILTIRDSVLTVLVIKRGNAPFRGAYALPGGFLRGDESLERTAARELAEETGLDAATLHLEQIGAYSAPDRDPRTPRVVTVAYLAIAPRVGAIAAGTDARSVEWMPVAKALSPEVALAFDHADILADAVERARAKLEHTTIATAFCAELFTIAELRAVYEAVWGHELDRPNFHRKVTLAEGFVVATDQKRQSRSGRPATLYRAGPATRLSPSMQRPRTDPRTRAPGSS
jgi:8-oxo-dGTP diphosphatase